MLFGRIKLLRLVLVGCGLALLIMGEEFRQRSRFFLLLGPLCCDLGIDQAERLRQPTGAVEKALGLFGHIALLHHALTSRQFYKSEPDQNKKATRRRDNEPTLRTIYRTAPAPR
jgi:hypothetical protein